MKLFFKKLKSYFSSPVNKSAKTITLPPYLDFRTIKKVRNQPFKW